MLLKKTKTNQTNPPKTPDFFPKKSSIIKATEKKY